MFVTTSHTPSLPIFASTFCAVPHHCVVFSDIGSRFLPPSLAYRALSSERKDTSTEETPERKHEIGLLFVPLRARESLSLHSASPLRIRPGNAPASPLPRPNRQHLPSRGIPQSPYLSRSPSLDAPLALHRVGTSALAPIDAAVWNATSNAPAVRLRHHHHHHLNLETRRHNASELPAFPGPPPLAIKRRPRRPARDRHGDDDPHLVAVLQPRVPTPAPIARRVHAGETRGRVAEEDGGRGGQGARPWSWTFEDCERC